MVLEVGLRERAGVGEVVAGDDRAGVHARSQRLEHELGDALGDRGQRELLDAARGREATARARAPAGSLRTARSAARSASTSGSNQRMAAEDGDVDVVRDVDDAAVDQRGVASSRNASCALQREAMTGAPQASASISGRPQPSPRVGET